MGEQVKFKCGCSRPATWYAETSAAKLKIILGRDCIRCFRAKVKKQTGKE